VYLGKIYIFYNKPQSAGTVENIPWRTARRFLLFLRKTRKASRVSAPYRAEIQPFSFKYRRIL
jgi:hypothetical protein